MKKLAVLIVIFLVSIIFVLAVLGSMEEWASAAELSDDPPAPPPGAVIDEELYMEWEYPNWVGAWGGFVWPAEGFVGLAVEYYTDNGEPSGIWETYWDSEMGNQSIPSSVYGTIVSHYHNADPSYTGFSINFGTRTPHRAVLYITETTIRTSRQHQAYIPSVQRGVESICSYRTDPDAEKVCQVEFDEERGWFCWCSSSTTP